MTTTLLQGDCRDVLPTLEAQSVQVCITSPPYYGLRDYNTGTWEGGSAECGHIASYGGHLAQSVTSTKGGGHKQHEAQTISYRDLCGKCGARRIDRQIGMEQTLAEYVQTLVAVFREVWRVLRDNATLWLNLGDSFGANKQLLGVPWRVAFALQDDGWILRSDIIWSKGNPMPESVTDRPTKAHEYLFLFAKQPKYYYNADAIAEPSVGELPISRMKFHDGLKAAKLQSLKSSRLGTPADTTRNKRSVWSVNTRPYTDAHFAVFPEALVEPCILAGSRPGDTALDPFMGSGTVARVATRLQRHSIGIELNEQYIELQRKRTDGVQVAMVEVFS